MEAQIVLDLSSPRAACAARLGQQPQPALAGNGFVLAAKKVLDSPKRYVLAHTVKQLEKTEGWPNFWAKLASFSPAQRSRC